MGIVASECMVERLDVLIREEVPENGIIIRLGEICLEIRYQRGLNKKATVEEVSTVAIKIFAAGQSLKE